MKLRIQQDADRDEHVASHREAKRQIRSADVSKVSTHEPFQSEKFRGKPLGDLLIIEVSANTDRLSISAREAGFRRLSVDKSSERCKGAHIATFDLSQDSDVARLVEIIAVEKNKAWLHFAPACGTASRAREKRLPKLESAGIAVPQPLKSEQFPLCAQCSLPDLNRDLPCPVFPEDLNRDRLRSVFPAGPQPRPSALSVPCRTSTATCRAQCSLTGLNRDHLRSVFPAGPQPRD